MKIAALLLVASCSGCFSLARRSWQEVDVATNIPAVVEFNGARGQSGGGQWIGDAPGAKEPRDHADLARDAGGWTTALYDGGHAATWGWH